MHAGPLLDCCGCGCSPLQGVGEGVGLREEQGGVRAVGCGWIQRAGGGWHRGGQDDRAHVAEGRWAAGRQQAFPLAVGGLWGAGKGGA